VVVLWGRVYIRVLALHFVRGRRSARPNGNMVIVFVMRNGLELHLLDKHTRHFLKLGGGFLVFGFAVFYLAFECLLHQDRIVWEVRLVVRFREALRLLRGLNFLKLLVLVLLRPTQLLPV
jgi:hypothetical protein